MNNVKGEHMRVSKEEVLAYAYECKKNNPGITSDELRALLRGKFMAPDAGAGAIANPMDWFRGLFRIYGGLIRLLDENDQQGIADIIEGVLIIVM